MAPPFHRRNDGSDPGSTKVYRESLCSYGLSKEHLTSKFNILFILYGINGKHSYAVSIQWCLV